MFFVGILPTLRDAHRRLLKPGARIIPAGARLRGQLFQCDELWQCHDTNIELPLGTGVR